jgi:aryl-alcohol dehydrogenase-like predicted oxidoreductase
LRLGDVELTRIGLGCMPMSVGAGRERGRANETIGAALDAGVNLLDTADAYALDESEVGHNERLVAAAIRAHAAGAAAGTAADARRPLVATKGGHTRHGTRWDLDGSPSHLRAACEASLRALGTDAIDLYQLHRPDPRTPYAESVGVLWELRDEGKVRHVGLSNATVAQLEEAERIVPVAAIQNELSPRYTAPLANGEVAACERRGIPFLAWSPLGGFATAGREPGRVPAIKAIAAERGVSAQRVTLAWLMSLSPAIVPLVGASRPETILDSVAALELELERDELDRLNAELV